MTERGTIQEGSEVKTHEEILAMLQELNEFEQRLKHPELLQPKSKEEPVVEQEIPVISDEFVEVPTQEEPNLIEEPEQPKQKNHTSRKLQRRRKIPKAKIRRGHSLHFSRTRNKQTSWDVHIPTESIGGFHPHSTFTIRIDDAGSLIGLPVKQPAAPKPEKEHRRFAFLHRTKKVEGNESPEEAPKGIKGKLKKLIPHRRKSKGEKGESSGSGVGLKLKGVFSRRKSSDKE